MMHDVFNEEYGYRVISCDKGEYITSYKDGDDIKNYLSFTVAYCPKNTDISNYRIVTAEENADYEIRKEEERKKDEEERKPKKR